MDLLVIAGKIGVVVDVAALGSLRNDGFDKTLADDNIVGRDKDSFEDAVAGVAQNKR